MRFDDISRPSGPTVLDIHNAIRDTLTRICNLGGMTEDEAKDRLSSLFEVAASRPVRADDVVETYCRILFQLGDDEAFKAATDWADWRAEGVRQFGLGAAIPDPPGAPWWPRSKPISADELRSAIGAQSSERTKP